MRIKELKLYTNLLKEEKEFYSKTLGCQLVEETKSSFTVQIGWSKLSFASSNKSHLYHYCFLIPSNQLQEAMNWMSTRVDILELSTDTKFVKFDSWNAESFYFYDVSGNIAEFIVRYDLKNESSAPFTIENLLSVNEIGAPTNDIPRTNAELKSFLNSDYWLGNESRFGTHGSQEGLVLLPNYMVKDEWFPTGQKITSEPFEVVLENEGIEKRLTFENEKFELM